MNTTARHVWKGGVVRRTAACDSPDGNDRTERVCVTCGVMMVTVHGAQGVPWIEWLSPDGRKLAQRPECIVVQPLREAA